MPAPACWDLHGELNSTLNAGADRARRGFCLGLTGLPVENTAIPWKPQWKPAAGNHAKWLLFVVTDLVTTDQATQVRSSRIGGCEPEVRTTGANCPSRTPECVPAVRTWLHPTGKPFARRSHPGHSRKKTFSFRGLAQREGRSVRNAIAQNFLPPPRPHFFGLAFRPFLSVHSFGCRATKRRTSNLWRSGVSLLGRQPLGKLGAMVDPSP